MIVKTIKLSWNLDFDLLIFPNPGWNKKLNLIFFATFYDVFYCARFLMKNFSKFIVRLIEWSKTNCTQLKLAFT